MTKTINKHLYRHCSQNNSHQSFNWFMHYIAIVQTKNKYTPLFCFWTFHMLSLIPCAVQYSYQHKKMHYSDIIETIYSIYRLKSNFNYVYAGNSDFYCIPSMHWLKIPYLCYGQQLRAHQSKYLFYLCIWLKSSTIISQMFFKKVENGKVLLSLRRTIPPWRNVRI